MSSEAPTFRVGALDTAEGDLTYDALIATVGFESRSTAIAEHLGSGAAATWAFDYAAHHVHSYAANRAYFEAHTIFDEPDAAYRKRIAAEVDELRLSLNKGKVGAKPVTPRVAVDISCMDRDRLARTVMALTVDQPEPLDVDFYYSFATFSGDLKGSEGTVLVNHAIEGLEGWTTDPDAALICLIGLGYENRLALAAVETLEPTQVIALLPRGDDGRYDDVVLDRNRSLLGEGEGASRRDVVSRPYQVADPFQTTVDLDATVGALSRQGRVVIVPLGPKVLALSSILVGLSRPDAVTVWRVSADDGRTPEDRESSGVFVGLRLNVTPSNHVEVMVDPVDSNLLSEEPTPA